MSPLPERGPRARRTLVPVSAALAALLLFGAAGCGPRHAEHPAASAAPTGVTVATLAAVDEPARVEAGGTLRAAREADVAGKVMGNVLEVRRHAGDFVKAGEVLVVVDSRDIGGQIAQAEGALAQARAAAALAETNFHRFEQLAARGSASRLELDQARYQFDTATGAVQQAGGAVATARSYRAYAEITAPFAGRVVDQLCQVGDLAAPGRPLMRLQDAEHLRLYATLEASRAGAAVVGALVPVRVALPEERALTGRVTEVTPAADAGTRSLLVKIDLPADSTLTPGLFARAFLAEGSRRALRVPATAVVRRGGLVGAFVVEEGHAAFRLLQLATPDGGEPEVLSGLVEGDRVVLAPPAGLDVGAPLEVRS